MHVSLKRDAEAPSKARALVLEQLRRRANEELTDRAVLAVSELVTNAVQHGRGAHVDLDVRCGAALHVGVADEGPGELEPTEAPEDSTHGRGLYLVSKLADGWGVWRHARGKSVWFTLRRSAA